MTGYARALGFCMCIGASAYLIVTRGPDSVGWGWFLFVAVLML